MAKRKKKAEKICTQKKITFKTKRGKTITFTGRPSGSAVCGNPKVGRSNSSGAKEMRKAFTAAVKACIADGIRPKGKVPKHGKSAFNRCVSEQLGGSGK